MHWLVGMERVNSCLIGWPDSFLRNGGIDLRAVRLIAERGVGAGVHRRAIVGVNHVAGGAAAVPIVAGMIVGAGQRKNRIQQARLLQAQKHRVGAQLGAEAAIAQLVVGRAGIFFGIRIADFRARVRRRARTRAGYCPAAKLPSAPADPDAAACLCSRVLLAIGGGNVLMRCGTPSGE